MVVDYWQQFEHQQLLSEIPDSIVSFSLFVPPLPIAFVELLKFVLKFSADVLQQLFEFDLEFEMK